MSTEVRGTIDVYVTVEDGEVTRVVADDASFEWRPADGEDERAAQAAADNGQCWPGWEWGW